MGLFVYEFSKFICAERCTLFENTPTSKMADLPNPPIRLPGTGLPKPPPRLPVVFAHPPRIPAVHAPPPVPVISSASTAIAAEDSHSLIDAEGLFRC